MSKYVPENIVKAEKQGFFLPTQAGLRESINFVKKEI